MIRPFVIAALISANFFWTASVHASSQSHITATATAKVVEDIAIVSQQPLNFGFVTPSAKGGTVTVSPDSRRSATGDIRTSLSFAPATFSVRGAAGYSYSIHTPSSTTFSVKKREEKDDRGHLVDELTVKDFVTYSATAKTTGTTGRLDSAGQDRIYLGATLVVPANAAPGIYSGQVPLTVSY